MPPRDYDRWQQNTDGSWSRRLGPHTEQGLRASAAAVELAHTHGLDLATVTGTGKHGKITKADVETAAMEEH